MKVCTCGACKWKTKFENHVPMIQCLSCYTWFIGKGAVRKLKDKKEKATR